MRKAKAEAYNNSIVFVLIYRNYPSDTEIVSVFELEKDAEHGALTIMSDRREHYGLDREPSPDDIYFWDRITNGEESLQVFQSPINTLVYSDVDEDIF